MTCTAMRSWPGGADSGSGRSRRGRLRMEPGAQDVQGLDGLRGVDVGLLFDDVPTVADVEGGGPKAQAPREMEPASHLTDGGVDELELVGLAEPRAEGVGHRCRSLPLHGTRRQHGPEPDPRI